MCSAVVEEAAADCRLLAAQAGHNGGSSGPERGPRPAVHQGGESRTLSLRGTDSPCSPCRLFLSTAGEGLAHLLQAGPDPGAPSGEPEAGRGQDLRLLPAE